MRGAQVASEGTLSKKVPRERFEQHAWPRLSVLWEKRRTPFEPYLESCTRLEGSKWHLAFCLPGLPNWREFLLLEWIRGVRVGFAAAPCGSGFRVGFEVGWVATCRHAHKKKKNGTRATTLNGEAEPCLGWLKACACSNDTSKGNCLLPSCQCRQFWQSLF